MSPSYQRRATKLSLSLILAMSFSSVSLAETYFQEDFENGTISTSANPVWSWKSPISGSNYQTAMMFGDGDMYSVSDDIAFTGSYSWRLNFNGRNNWCNLCGSKEVSISSSEIAAGCISTTGSPWGDVIYNKSNGFSAWEIISSVDNLVCFNTASAIGNSVLSGGNVLSSGDDIAIPYQCGVNGTVGGDSGRRSDCDKAINYLNGVNSSQLDYGESISRRFYLYIPSATVLPRTTLKLGYAHFNKNGSTSSNTLKLSVQRGLTLELSTPGGTVVDMDFAVQRNKWYYFEEIWTRESSSSASDGKYTLYASDAGLAPQSPRVSLTNVKVGSLIDMSVNGNFQHSNEVSGYVYFDDVLISDGYAGPIGVTIPKAPALINAE